MPTSLVRAKKKLSKCTTDYILTSTGYYLKQSAHRAFVALFQQEFFNCFKALGHLNYWKMFSLKYIVLKKIKKKQQQSLHKFKDCLGTWSE